MALRREDVPFWQRWRRLQAPVVGFQRRHASPAKGGKLIRRVDWHMLTDRFQVSARTRGSISTQSISLLRQRTESASVVNRIRSDSNRTGSFVQAETVDESEFLNHDVDAR